jgi:hypothetical protein
MKITTKDFFTKLATGQIMKGLPNFLDDGTRGDDIVSVKGIFIRDESGGRLYYESEANPVLTRPDVRQYISNKITKRYFSYFVVDGEYKLVSYGEVMRSFFKSQPDFFLPTCNKALRVHLHKTTHVPSYENSEIVSVAHIELLDHADPSNPVNVLDKPNLRDFMLERRPISIEQLVDQNQILKFPIAVNYLAEKHESIRKIMIPYQRRFKIANLLSSIYTG